MHFSLVIIVKNVCDYAQVDHASPLPPSGLKSSAVQCGSMGRYNQRVAVILNLGWVSRSILPHCSSMAQNKWWASASQPSFNSGLGDQIREAASIFKKHQANPSLIQLRARGLQRNAGRRVGEAIKTCEKIPILSTLSKLVLRYN